MSEHQVEISVKGRQVPVSAVRVGSFDIVTTGQWLKRAFVKSEEYVEADPAAGATELVEGLKNGGCRADIFSFAQRVPDVLPKYEYPMEWDNVAAISLTTYEAWMEKLSQDTRRNVRLAGKRGIVVRNAVFTDEFVEGIRKIYNESPIRQGRKFWHYGKGFDAVKAENGTFADRSQWIGAYLGDELTGFLKYVRVGKSANIMQILALNSHQDKKPMNALVAKAVEVACHSGLTHLLYRKYVYLRPDALTEFKRRNGFEKVQIPRYNVPLTAKGRLALKLHLNRGVKEMMPEKLMELLLKVRHLSSSAGRRAQAPSGRLQDAAIQADKQI